MVRAAGIGAPNAEPQRAHAKLKKPTMLKKQQKGRLKRPTAYINRFSRIRESRDDPSTGLCSARRHFVTPGTESAFPF